MTQPQVPPHLYFDYSTFVRGKAHSKPHYKIETVESWHLIQNKYILKSPYYLFLLQENTHLTNLKNPTIFGLEFVWVGYSASGFRWGKRERDIYLPPWDTHLRASDLGRGREAGVGHTHPAFKREKRERETVKDDRAWRMRWCYLLGHWNLPAGWPWGRGWREAAGSGRKSRPHCTGKLGPLSPCAPPPTVQPAYRGTGRIVLKTHQSLLNYSKV